MGAFASVTLPLAAGLVKGAAEIAQDVVACFPGTRNVVLDAAGTTLTFDLHFPGNLSALVTRLANSRIGVGARATVSVPTMSLAPELLTSPEHVTERLNEGAEVWDPEFPRGSYVSDAKLVDGRVHASIVPSTEGMHQLYDSMFVLGLTAGDGELQPADGIPSFAGLH
jgi:hypothetical protein